MKRNQESRKPFKSKKELEQLPHENIFSQHGPMPIAESFGHYLSEELFLGQFRKSQKEKKVYEGKQKIAKEFDKIIVIKFLRYLVKTVGTDLKSYMIKTVKLGNCEGYFFVNYAKFQIRKSSGMSDDVHPSHIFDCLIKVMTGIDYKFPYFTIKYKDLGINEKSLIPLGLVSCSMESPKSISSDVSVPHRFKDMDEVFVLKFNFVDMLKYSDMSWEKQNNYPYVYDKNLNTNRLVNYPDSNMLETRKDSHYSALLNEYDMYGDIIKS